MSQPISAGQTITLLSKLLSIARRDPARIEVRMRPGAGDASDFSQEKIATIRVKTTYQLSVEGDKKGA